MAAGGSDAVAVIIPVYNGENFIRRALDSVLGQSHAAAEIVVVDDGSKDRTREIVESEYGGRVRLIAQANGGPAKARNTAMRASTSELIAFLDADDWWEPEKLARQVEAMRAHPEAVLCNTGLRVVDDDGKLMAQVQAMEGDLLWPALRWRNMHIPPSCVMIRRDALEKAGGFSERQVGSEDWLLWFTLRRMAPFCTCPDALTDYRSSPGGLSGNAEHMFNDFKKMLDDLLADFSGLERELWRRRIVSYQAYMGAMTARGAGDRTRELAFLKMSIATWPSLWWAPVRFKALAVTLLRPSGKS